MSRKNSIRPLLIFSGLWIHRYLIWQMTKRDILGRYRGSFIGLLWSFLNPLFMLIIYTLVFGYVFQSQWPKTHTSIMEFATILFTGLIIFNFFSECISRAPGIILNNVNYVKKIVFPLEIFPWMMIGTSLFHTTLNLLVLIIFRFLIHPSLSWSFLCLPLVFLPLIFFILGTSWFLAALGVYIRDVGQTVNILIPALMFLSPIFYPMTAVPENLHFIQYVNPLCFIIEQTRDVLLWGRAPQFIELGIYFLASLVVTWLGFTWFQKTRNGFADVI